MVDIHGAKRQFDSTFHIMCARSTCWLTSTRSRFWGRRIEAISNWICSISKRTHITYKRGKEIMRYFGACTYYSCFPCHTAPIHYRNIQICVCVCVCSGIIQAKKWNIENLFALSISRIIDIFSNHLLYSVRQCIRSRTRTCIHSVLCGRFAYLGVCVCARLSPFGLISSIWIVFILGYNLHFSLFFFMFSFRSVPFFVGYICFAWKILWCWYCHCFSTVNIMLLLYIMGIMDSASYIIIIVLLLFFFYCHYYFLFYLEQFSFCLVTGSGALVVLTGFQTLCCTFSIRWATWTGWFLFATFCAISCVYLYSLTIHKNGISLLWRRESEKNLIQIHLFTTCYLAVW